MHEDQVLRMALACIRWSQFGECRTDGWPGLPPTAADTVAALEASLAMPQPADSALENAAEQFIAWREDGVPEHPMLDYFAEIFGEALAAKPQPVGGATYEIPEWSKMDDLGGRVPSDVRIALREAFEVGRSLSAPVAQPIAADAPLPVAEVAAGKYGNRLMWHFDGAQESTPVGTMLYAAAPAQAAAVPEVLYRKVKVVRAYAYRKDDTTAGADYTYWHPEYHEGEQPPPGWFRIDYRDVYEPIAAPAQAAAVPEGWKLVPVEPTPAMLVAMWEDRDGMRGKGENAIARVGYANMLAAAPEAGAGGGK